MANDVFHIPGQMGEQPLQNALRIADSLQYSPEKQSEAYRFIKDTADRIHSYRDAALEADKNRKKGLLNAFGLVRQDLTIVDLIEAESRVGGKMFGHGHRFWLEHKGSSKHIEKNEVDDWYHTQPIVLQNGKIGEIAIHFESRPGQFIKLIDGKPYPLTVAELETICKAIPLYEEQILAQLEHWYMVDAELHDLQEEIQHEIEEATPKIISIEDRMARQAAEQMIDNHLARVKQEEQMRDSQARFAARATEAHYDRIENDDRLAA